MNIIRMNKLKQFKLKHFIKIKTLHRKENVRKHEN